jgi:hypothetical protein
VKVSAQAGAVTVSDERVGDDKMVGLEEVKGGGESGG